MRICSRRAGAGLDRSGSSMSSVDTVCHSQNEESHRGVDDDDRILAHPRFCQQHSTFPTPTARPSLPPRAGHVEVRDTRSSSPRLSRVRPAVCPPWSPSRNLTSETKFPKCRRDASRRYCYRSVSGAPAALKANSATGSGLAALSAPRADAPDRSGGRAEPGNRDVPVGVRAHHIRAAFDLLSCFLRDKSEIGVRTRELMCAAPTVGWDTFISGVSRGRQAKAPNRCRDRPRFAKPRQQGTKETLRHFHHKLESITS
jgi:hypothetical protein